MSHPPSSQFAEQLDQCLVLDVTIEDLQFRAYVAVSAPDLDLVAAIVPSEQFEQDGDVHVTAVSHPGEARTQIEDLAFNMNPGDAAVFMCGSQRIYEQVLEELGYAPV